jgi:hypothetical protein
MNSLIKPALIGGGILGVLSGIPIVSLGNCACCAWVIGGGVLAAYLYSQQIGPQVQPPYGPAAMLGVLTGAIGAVVSSLVALPFSLIGMGGGMAGIHEALRDMEGVPPEVQEALASFGAAGIGIGMMIVGFLFSLVLYTIFATIGSLIGITIFKK